MSYIDIIILVIIAIGAIRGFSKGLIVEIATLLALVLGVFITMRYSVYTEKILKDFFNASSPYTPYVALGVTFIVVVIGIYILGKLLTKLVDIISLGLVNKLLGTIFGAAKACLIICVLLLLVDALNDRFQFMNEKRCRAACSIGLCLILQISYTIQYDFSDELCRRFEMERHDSGHHAGNRRVIGERTDNGIRGHRPYRRLPACGASGVGDDDEALPAGGA